MPEPTSSTSTTIMTRAAHGLMCEAASTPPRCGSMTSEKCQATNSAMNQVATAAALGHRGTESLSLELARQAIRIRVARKAAELHHPAVRRGPREIGLLVRRLLHAQRVMPDFLGWCHRARLRDGFVRGCGVR